MKVRLFLTVLAILSIIAYSRSTCTQEQTSKNFYYPTGSKNNFRISTQWLVSNCDGKDEYITLEGDPKYHVGADIVPIGRDKADGSPVYAISDGLVVYRSDKPTSGWGDRNIALVIKHELSNGQPFFAVYGHIRSSLNKGKRVYADKSFATIGPLFDENGTPIHHLHFGINLGLVNPSTGVLVEPRTNLGIMSCSNWPDTNGFVSPITWIETQNEEINHTDINSDLLKAAKEGDINMVKSLLDEGANVNHTSYTASALDIASASGHIEIVKLLLQNGADINKFHLNAGALATTLGYAVKNNKIDITRLLLQNGADINKKYGFGNTELTNAALYGHVGTLKVLLEHGAKIDEKDDGGITPLMRAASFGHVDFLKVLLEHGADVNARNNRDETALSYAEAKGHTRIVQILRERQDMLVKKKEAREEEELIARSHEFVNKYRIQSWPPIDELFANPFVYDGKTIAITARFLSMQSATSGLFNTSDTPFIASSIPKGLFRVSGVKMVIAGKVIGNIEYNALGTSMYIPHLKFVGVHFCKEGKDCAFRTFVVE